MPTFCELLDKAITDEKEAIKGYDEFQEELIPGIAAHFVSLEIENIKKDEKKHLATLEELKEDICK